MQLALVHFHDYLNDDHINLKIPHNTRYVDLPKEFFNSAMFGTFSCYLASKAKRKGKDKLEYDLIVYNSANQEQSN